MLPAKRTVFLLAFSAVMITAVSASMTWGFLDPRDHPVSVGNGSYQVRSADVTPQSRLFREDMEGIEPGTYQTDGPLENACSYALPEVSGLYPDRHGIPVQNADGPATVVIPPDGGLYGESGGFYSKGCQPWTRVE